MSKDRFDKLLKKQLESVQPPFQEQAWNNFKQLLPTPWYVVLFRKYGSWAYGGLSTIAVVITSYLFVQERQENKKLHEEIATLKNLQTEQEQNTQLNEAGPNIGVPDSLATTRGTAINQEIKPDTVYITQKVYVNPPAQRRTKPSLDNIPLQQVEQTAEENRKADTVASEKQKVAAPENVDGGNVQRNTVKDIVKSATTTVPDKADNSRPGVIADSASQVSSRTLATTRKDSVQQNAVNKAELNKEESKREPKKEKVSISSLLDVQLRMGLSVDYLGFDKLSYGPTAELLLTNRFSFSGGLNVSKADQEQIRDTREYNRAKGKRFEDVYHNRVRPNQRVEEITLNTSVLRLPLALNFYIPTRSNFSFLFTGGTVLDVSVNQEVEFHNTLPGPGASAELVKFVYKPSPITFNNLVYGVGVQYQQGRLVWQLAPYYNYQFVKPEYSKPISGFGAQTSLKFSIGK